MHDATHIGGGITLHQGRRAGDVFEHVERVARHPYNDWYGGRDDDDGLGRHKRSARPNWIDGLTVSDLATPPPSRCWRQERPKLAEQLRALPDRPGVYLFKDGRGRLLYVGKAESLKDRVRSYFQPSTSFDQTHQPKLRQMTLQAQSVEYILTESPIQALIWENDLVRKEQPRFNTKLRDDKHYPYIRIDVQNPWPVAQGQPPNREGRCALLRAVPARDLGAPDAGHAQPAVPADPVQPHDHRQRSARLPLPATSSAARRPASARSTTPAYRELVDGMVRFLDGKNRSRAPRSRARDGRGRREPGVRAGG